MKMSFAMSRDIYSDAKVNEILGDLKHIISSNEKGSYEMYILKKSN